MIATTENLDFCKDQAIRLNACYPVGFFRSGMSEEDFDKLNANRDRHFEELAVVLRFIAKDQIEAIRIINLWLSYHRERPTSAQLIELRELLYGRGEPEAVARLQEWNARLNERELRNDDIPGVIL